MAENTNNINFIKTVFAGEVAKDFPKYNYRLRLAGLTEFEPYISEAPRFEGETDSNYNARILTSGRYFGEQEIILDDIVHSDQNIQGLEINSQFLDGKIPRTLLFLDKCELKGDEYLVHAKNLNDLGCVTHGRPFITFPVDGIGSVVKDSPDKGYLVYRKTSTVHKHDNSDNGALVSLASGWNQVTGFSSNDLIETLQDQSISVANRIKAAGFADSHTQNIDGGASVYRGYESLENELFTEYKVLNSGDFLEEDDAEGNRVYKKSSLVNELTARRTVNVKVDPTQNYSLERKVTRKSNDESNPAEWETIQHNVTFPFNDDEDLSDYVDTNVIFDVSGVYEVVAPTGDNSSFNDQNKTNDYFEVDLIDDWGKSERNPNGDLKESIQDTISNRAKTDYLTFRSGESIKLNQKSTLRNRGTDKDPIFDQFTSLDLAFSPFSTGQNGFLTGDGNDKNFYELEYQFVPAVGVSKKLYYETGESVSVGQQVFYNTGQEGGVYKPVVSNFFGQTPDILSEEASSTSVSDIDVIKGKDPADKTKILDFGPSYLLNSSSQLNPEVVAESVASGVGYSYFTSGEKYLVCPKAGYNTTFSDSVLHYNSAGETYKAFFQGEHSDDLSAHYALTEYKTFDDNPETEETFYPRKKKDIRIGESATCIGDSCSELEDLFYIPSPPYLLDRDYRTDFTLTNGSLLNIDGSDGSIKISNLKNNKQQFAKRSNLFFEKNYVASLTIMANGEKQDISALKQFIEDDKVYYLERDIYIDSDTSSQANFRGPMFTSYGTRQSIKPFSVDVSTPNPDSIGQEKLYVTQTYHKEDFKNANYPFSDYDYFNLQPSVYEEFTYSNNEHSIIDDFKLINRVSREVFRPGDFDCSIINKQDIERQKGYSVLAYFGTKITPTNATTDNVTYTPGATKINQGYYYQLQHSADSGKTWTTLSHAHEATSTSSIVISTGPNVTSETESEYRILEWAPSRILTSYGNMQVGSESPDSLILKSATDNKFYDISKCYHTVKRNGGFETVSDTDWSGTIHALNLEAPDSKYLSIASNRAFNILEGEFSIEFWIKKNSGTGTILERPGCFKVYMSDANTLAVNFNNAEVDQIQGVALGSGWQHIAVTKTPKSGGYILNIYIEGVLQEEKSIECNYDDFISNKNEPLEIGKSTLVARLYQPRIYIGKSLYTKKFTATKAEFAEQSNPLKYKILKYNYNRKVETGSNWIINRNTLDNSSVPSDYSLPNEDSKPFTTKHGYEWLGVTSANESSQMETRATVKYFNNYAYRAPNNPHINKNYEGTPVGKDFDINADSYAFSTREESSSEVEKPFTTAAAPYYYEYLGNSTIQDIRLNKKGGEDFKNIPLKSTNNTSFANASRLRVTKYVYRLYTKDALVVADTGFKGSRSAQEGWTYQLQHSVDSGSNWTNVDATESFEDYLIFYEDPFSLSSRPDGNLSHASILPTLVLKTDVTRKYKPEDIEFRVQKKQILSIASNSTNTEVFKKYNFLPLEVTMPTKNTLTNLAADSNYTTIDSTLKQAVITLDETETYVIHKDSSEKILTNSSTNSVLQLSSISVNSTSASDTVGSTETLSDLENNKPYEISNITGLRIMHNDASAISSLSDVDTVVSVKPSGLSLTRYEKDVNDIKRAESGFYDASNTKIFFTPSVTGSHFEGLNEFQKYTANNSSEDSLFSFVGESYITGANDTTSNSAVSGLTFEPVHKFYNNPYVTGAYTINADDDGKTFLVSGSNADLTFEGRDYSVEIANVGTSTVDSTYQAGKVSTVEVGDSASIEGTPTKLDTILPSVSNTNDSDSDGDFVIVDGLSKLDASTISQDTTVVNISTGDCDIIGLTAANNHTLGGLSGVAYSASKAKQNVVDSGVIVLDHEKIVLTPNDASETVFIDTNSKVYLPSGFSNGQDVTLVNSTDHQLEVIPESGFSVDSAAINYIPKRAARKFTCSTSANPGVRAASWAAVDVDVLSFNQLNVTNSDNQSVFVHNENVDVRLNSTSTSTGFFFTIARSQIDTIEFRSDLISQAKTRVIRVFIDGVLNYVSKPGELAITVKKELYGWSFENTPVLSTSSLVIGPEANGKVYLADREATQIDMKFDGGATYTNDFQIFIVSSLSIEDFSVYPSSSTDSLKFYEKGEGQIDEDSGYTSNISRSEAIRIYRAEAGTGKEVGKFFFETIIQSSIQKITHSASNKDQVIINYNDSTSFELPVLDDNFNENVDFKVDIINSSNSSSAVLLPKQAMSSDINKPDENEDRPIDSLEVQTITPFSSSSYSFAAETQKENPYQKFSAGKEEALDRANTIKHEDVVIFDGSASTLDVKEFLEESMGDKYTLADTHRELRISALGGNKFTLHNHNFKDKQKITFDLANLTVVDYYLEKNSWDPDSFNGTIKTGTSISAGETLLVCNPSTDKFFIYVDEGVDSGNRILTPISFSVGEINKGLIEETDEGYLFETPNEVFVYINKAAGKGAASINIATKVFDLADGELSTKSEQGAGTSLAANLSLTGEQTTQSLYIKTVNENEFELFADEALSSQVTSTTLGSYKFFSEYFYVEDSFSTNAHIINLSAGSIQPKNFSSQENIGSALAANKYNEYNLDNRGVYSTTDSTASGVYLVDGYNSSDTTDITALDSSQILITGNFYAQAALTDNDFDDHYFVNGGLDSVTIKNTNDSSTDSLAKNRAYKHDGDGAFTVQDLNDSSNRDIIYYPKNEIHVLDRKNLGLSKQNNPIGYNFVFYTYEEGQYDEDNKIVLPDTWDNLDNVAIVNMSDMPVSVVNFGGTQSATVNAKQVLFMTAADFTSNAVSLTYNEDEYEYAASGYVFSDQGGYFNVSLNSSRSKNEDFITSKVGEIILDYDIHDGKKIFVERDTLFVGPYIYKTDSSAKYEFNDDNFSFGLVNISASPVQELTTEQASEVLTLYSQYEYTTVLDDLAAQEEQNKTGAYSVLFNSIDPITDQQIDIEFAQPQPDSSKTYHVFGKQLNLKLRARYRSLSNAEAKEISFDQNVEIEADDYYRLCGLVEPEIRKLNIINTAFENVKISTISALEEGSDYELDGLNDKLLEYFEEETVDGETQVLSTYNTDSELIELSAESVVPKVFLGKDKVLKISTRDLIGDFSALVFDSKLNHIDEELPEQLLEVSFSDVRYIKKRKRVVQSTSSEDGNSMSSFAYSTDAYIPPAIDLDSDQYFTVINSSRSTIDLISSDGKNLNGSSATLSIASGAGKKIKFTKSSSSFSDVTSDANHGLTVSTVGSSISNVSGGVFTASTVNSASAPMLLNVSLGRIKIVNNTGAILYLKNSNASANINGDSVYAVSKNSYIDLIVDGDNFITENGNANISFTSLSTGILISSAIYQNKAVLFDVENIDRVSFDSDDFFTTTLIPFIRVMDAKKKQKSEYKTYDYTHRIEKYTVSYTIKNKKGTIQRTQSYKPVAISSSGFSTPNEPVCHLNEFLLDSSVNNKILLTNKYYDYVFKHSQSTTFHLYNRSSVDPGYSMRKLTSVGNVFTSANYLAGPTNEEDEIVEPITTKIAIKGVQSGASNPTITQKDTYNDIFIDNKLRKKVYLNKSFYANKIIVMKEAYDVIYNTDSNINLAYINLSDTVCNVFDRKINKKDEEDNTSTIDISSVIVDKSENHTVSKPLHSISSSDRTYVITQPADITSTVSSVKLINASRANVDVTVGGKSKKLYFGEKATYTDADTVTYRKCPGYNRKEWYLKLVDADIAHLERDKDYFDQSEFDSQMRTRKNIMLEFVASLHKFSNFFQTNLYVPLKYRSGYESISTYNKAYQFGVTIHGNKKSQVVDVTYDTNPIDYIASGLRLSWDMPKKVIAYGMNTGHERLTHCKEFDERNNLVTLTGIEPDRAYVLEDFDETELNFVNSAIKSTSEGVPYPEYKYSGTETRVVAPCVIYNGKTYKPGERFFGVAGKSDYQLKDCNFAILKASQFINKEDIKLNQDEESEQLNEEFKALNDSIKKKADKDTAFGLTSEVQYPIWTASSSDDHKNGFINATVEKVYSYGANVELLQNRKLKDIQGVYRKEKIKEVESENEEVKFENVHYFEFEIPKHKDVTSYSSTYSDVVEMTGGDDPDKFVFRVNFGEGVDYPGYEYEIKSSLTFQNNFKTDKNQQKSIMRLAVSEKDSLPFSADGSIKSLNLNFATDFDKEARVQASDYEGSFSKRLAVEEGNRIFTLKNNIGYSFVPFGQYLDELYGLSMISEKGKRDNKAIRFRLKKLNRREITFEDLKTDQKVGKYLTNNSEEADLKYIFDTEVNSISYHDIAKPGGVLENICNWTTLAGVSAAEVITVTDIDVNDGDAVGLIKQGTPDKIDVYFARVDSKNVSSNVTETKFKLLKIFSKDTSLDVYNKVDVANGDFIKLLNYFELKTIEDGTHRQVKSILPSMYNADEGGNTTLMNPILISNQMFFLEAARTELNNERADLWGDFVFKGNKIRANFELSTVARHWFGETSRGKNWQSENTSIPFPATFDLEPSRHWVNENIFESYKNLLYRDTTQIERVNYSGNTYTYNVKLNKNISYRYIYKNSDEKSGVKTFGSFSKGGGQFYSESEDLKIVVIGGDNEKQRRERIYKNICLIESTDYIDPCPYKNNNYASDHAKYSENIGHKEYVDYQIPFMNNEVDVNAGYEAIFGNTDPSYYTEGFESLFSYDSKAENLVIGGTGLDIKPISSDSFKAGLFYDFGMPAVCKYIYAVYANKNKLAFLINDFWDGFLDGFGGPGTLYKVRPKSFNYDLESYDGSSWSTVEANKTKTDENKTYAIETSSEISKDTKYRLKINSVEIQYRNPSTEEDAKPYTEATIDYIRLPFKWTSTIKDGDLGSSTSSRYTLDLKENHLIGKSISIPEDGISRFGEFHYKKDGIPYTRLYMFNLEHKLRANYKDPINRAGISKVIITDKGDNYRTPPTATINAPTVKGGTQATARSIIENGKLKFIEVVNSGSGYKDMEKGIAKRIEQSKLTGTPFITQTTTIGAVDDSNTDKSLDYDGNVSAAFNSQNGLTTVPVTLTANEASLPPEIQEEFGLTFEDTEAIAKYNEEESITRSNSRAKVDFMAGSSEDDETWSDIQAQADRIQGINNFVNETLNDAKEAARYDGVSDQEAEEIRGTEDSNIYGLYKEDNTDASKNAFLTNSITFDNDGNISNVVQFETHPTVENGSAVAVVNDSSIAEYRVINNNIATKTTPWISSFSREQNPSLPQSFGLLPSTEITAEVFNSYARAINYLTKIRVEAPIFAKVRRYRQVEWRYISNPVMAGLTFPSMPVVVDSGQAEHTYSQDDYTLDSMTFDKQSKVNYIQYIDPENFKLTKAYFSSFTNDGAGKTKDGSAVDKENISTIDLWDEFNEELNGIGKERFEVQDDRDTPSDVGFPNTVNIPQGLGVHCNPADYYYEGGTGNIKANKSKGLTLPTPINKRAWAYGGEIINYATSEIFDVSSDTNPFELDASYVQGRVAKLYTQGELNGEQFEPITTDLVDIRGGEYIKAGYQNEIVFGCQANGKPFQSAFLRTTKVWTEYEVVASPEFTDTLPEGIREKYKPEESKLRCHLHTKKVNCENAVIGKVQAKRYHNICDNGRLGGQIIHSYESEFGLVEGDDVIAPKTLVNESSGLVQSAAKGTLKVEPEFNLALTVYISNKLIPAISPIGGLDRKLGPCMHHCMPGELKTLSLTDDPLIFDLKK